MTKLDEARRAVAGETYWADIGEHSNADALTEAIEVLARAVAREEIEANEERLMREAFGHVQEEDRPIAVAPSETASATSDAPAIGEMPVAGEFAIGEPVTKVGGDYRFDGVVVGRFSKRSGAVRYAIEDDRGVLHIYSDKNLQRGVPARRPSVAKQLAKALQKARDWQYDESSGEPWPDAEVDAALAAYRKETDNGA